ncbi:hypothetical protein BDD12DRAFT_892768 [Trichophaea hybrida]|nr:hypothetical protein BDD12DRAFT_892768 [Trichophaea hybrida]
MGKQQSMDVGIRIRRRTTYEIPVYLLQIRQSYNGRMQQAKHPQSEISTSRCTKDKPRIRKGGNVARTVTKADSLVTSKLIAFTANEFKNSKHPSNSGEKQSTQQSTSIKDIQNEGLAKRDNRDGYKAPYETPNEMLHAFGKPTHDDDGNKISAEAKSKPYMMAVKAQSEVIFDEDRNAHISCLQGNENDIFELPQETKYVEELEDNTSGTGEGHGSGAHGQNDEAGGDAFLHGRIADNTSGTGEGHGSGAHGCTDDISDALQRRWLPANSGSRTNTSRAPDEEAENIAHSRRLRSEDQTTQRSAAEAENIAHRRRLRREDQYAQRSAADAENIVHSRCLRRKDQTARCSAAIKKSS